MSLRVLLTLAAPMLALGSEIGCLEVQDECDEFPRVLVMQYWTEDDGYETYCYCTWIWWKIVLWVCAVILLCGGGAKAARTQRTVVYIERPASTPYVGVE